MRPSHLNFGTSVCRKRERRQRCELFSLSLDSPPQLESAGMRQVSSVPFASASAFPLPPGLALVPRAIPHRSMPRPVVDTNPDASDSRRPIAEEISRSRTSEIRFDKEGKRAIERGDRQDLADSRGDRTPAGLESRAPSTYHPPCSLPPPSLAPQPLSQASPGQKLFFPPSLPRPRPWPKHRPRPSTAWSSLRPAIRPRPAPTAREPADP